MKLTKEQLAIYAAGVFDSAGTISQNRPIVSALLDTKKHHAMQQLHKAFGGQLTESPGTGRGEGKTFIQYSIPDTKQRTAFFKAILPFTTATESVERHIESLK